MNSFQVPETSYANPQELASERAESPNQYEPNNGWYQLDEELLYAQQVQFISPVKFNHDVAIIVMSFIPHMKWLVTGEAPEEFGAPAGTVLFVPGQKVWEIRGDKPADFLLMSLPKMTPSEHPLTRLQDKHKGAVGAAWRCVDHRVLVLSRLVCGEMRKEMHLPSQDLGAFKHLVTSFLRTDGLGTKHGSKGHGSRKLSQRQLERLEEFVKHNLNNKIGVAAMARVCGVSGSHFMILFQASVGQTPHQFVLERRLDKADELLINTNMPLAEIAHLVGFSSHSHMATVFKAKRHTTPGERRRASQRIQGRMWHGGNINSEGR